MKSQNEISGGSKILKYKPTIPHSFPADNGEKIKNMRYTCIQVIDRGRLRVI